MSKKVWLSIVVSLAVVAGVALAVWVPSSQAIAGSNTFAQEAKTGEWTASLSDQHSDKDAGNESGKLQLNFERHTDKGGRHQMGHSYDFADLQGLSREQVVRGGPVRFSIVREAGRIDCEGAFKDGRGSGTFTFSGNQGFVAAMKSRGFDFAEPANKHNDGDTEDRLFAAATLNVTTALADDLTSAGFGKLGVGDLFKAAIFKIDSQFMREMKATGFADLGMEDLVKARIFKIDADFVRHAAEMGFAREPFETLVKMQIFKVTPEFINEVRNDGLTNLEIEDLVKLRIFKIDSAFIRAAKADGVPLEVERLVQRRIGVERHN